jgi:hypothetical protein
VYRTENIVCESGFENLAERRKKKFINTSIHVAENSSHRVNRWFNEKEAYQDYALSPKLSRSFFVRALEASLSFEVDPDMVESTRQLKHPPLNLDNILR